MNPTLKRAVALALGLWMTACGSTPPPKELLDARAAYQRAESGKAAQLSPVPVHEAKRALEAAEAANAEDPESERTRDLAYVALRKAELAQTEGSIAHSNAQREGAQKELTALQAQDLQRTRGELSKTKEQLSATSNELANEKKAREAAEKRARDAMDKLAVAAALAVKEETRGTVITIPGAVLFQSNKSDLLPAARQKLDAVAEALKNQDEHKMVVEGHTDSQGLESENLTLGQRRAQSVRDYLVSRGVPGDKISAVGIGQGRPVGDNRTPEGRAQNRRVEIIVTPLEKR